MGLSEASAGDDRLKALRALRDALAGAIDDCDSKRDLAALAQRFMDVVEQIDELGGGAKPEPKETGLSDFERRLRERESAPKASRSTSG